MRQIPAVLQSRQQRTRVGGNIHKCSSLREVASPVLCLAVSMPKTPKGHKRPADVISNAVRVMKIATGEIEETLTEDGKSKAAVELINLCADVRLGVFTSKPIARRVGWTSFRRRVSQLALFGQAADFLSRCRSSPRMGDREIGDRRDSGSYGECRRNRGMGMRTR